MSKKKTRTEKKKPKQEVVNYNQWLPVMLYLKELKVSEIACTYSGSGDSGDIDDIDYYMVRKLGRKEVDRTSVEVDGKINDFVRNQIDTIISGGSIEDWWNDEGGQGEMNIEVPSGNYTISNHIRVVSFDSSNHEGQFLHTEIEEEGT